MSHYDEKSQAEKAKAKQGQQGQQNPQTKQTGMREQDIRGKGREQGNPSQARGSEIERERSSYERGNVEH